MLRQRQIQQQIQQRIQEQVLSPTKEILLFPFEKDFIQEMDIAEKQQQHAIKIKEHMRQGCVTVLLTADCFPSGEYRY